MSNRLVGTPDRPIYPIYSKNRATIHYAQVSDDKVFLNIYSQNEHEWFVLEHQIPIQVIKSALKNLGDE